MSSQSGWAVLALALVACGEAQGPVDRFAITIAPLGLDDVDDVEYRLTVSAGAQGQVWQQTVHATTFGDGRSATYVGPCDASAGTNVVALEIVAIEAGGRTLVDGSDYRNPAPLGSPITQSVACTANSDTPVRFDLTIARAAKQGFFDVAVAFEDVFCSAKLDCQGAGGAPNLLLFAPGTETRIASAVMGFACTGGVGGSTYLWMDRPRLVCGNDTYELPIDGGTGNVYTTNPLGPLAQVAVYRGVETVQSNGVSAAKTYANAAFALDPLNAGQTCTLHALATVSERPFTNRTTPAAVYPIVRWDVVPVADATGFVCGQQRMDDGGGVRTTYAHADARESFDFGLTDDGGTLVVLHGDVTCGDGICDVGETGAGCPEDCLAQCPTGTWGAACDRACVAASCTSAVTCDRTTGVVQSCGACADGSTGPTCASPCPTGSCDGAITCDQGGGMLSCTSCADGTWGTTCTNTCADARCAGGILCEQGSGATTWCAACAPGFTGPTCADACPSGSCEGAVTCDQSGTLLSCTDCTRGSWGNDCGATCTAAHCNDPDCDQQSGATTTCTGCDSGWFGATCTSPCPLGHCGVGERTCTMDAGVLTSCETCVAPWSGPTCETYDARATCLAWKQSGASTDGLYWIDPDGAAGPASASHVYCDMSNGGFTYLKLAEAGPLSAAEAEAECAERGMQLFIPRTPAHLARAFAIASDGLIGPDGGSAYLRIMGIYPRVAGATCANTPLQSDNPSCNWVASDDGVFWVSNRGDVAQPSGNNTLGGSMGYTFDAVGNASTWDDTTGPGYTSTRFICDTGDVGVTAPRIGDDASNPAESCLFLFGLGRPSGPYSITTDLGPRRLYCDMTPGDGGWTLVGEANARADVYGTWLRGDLNVANLATTNIESGVMASAAVIDLAVNRSTHVRLSNQARTRWVRWPMAAGRTLATWWNHGAGQATIDAAADLSVTVTAWNNATATCYQNIYGVMPLSVHGGSYPFASMNTAGNTNINDLCMGVGVQVTTTTADGFTQNGNGFDAAQNDNDWPNSSYSNVTPFVSVWLR